MNPTEAERLLGLCSQALRLNVPDPEILRSLSFRYTCPARENGAYLPQWLWDSCFHAVAYRWFDPDMAWEELQSLLVHQLSDGADAGMIPHMSHLDENGDRVAQELFHRKHCSFLTQPPLISTAFLSVYQKAPRKTILRNVYPKLLAYHDWFDRRRDTDNDGLVAIIHPWESGWDASQRWDEAMGMEEATGTDVPYPKALMDPDFRNLRELESRRRRLAGLIESCNCDAAVLSGVPGGFYAEPVDFNAIRSADLEALSMIALELGENEEARQLEKRARRTRQAIQDKMISRIDGVLKVHDLIGASCRQSQVDHAGKFVLLYGGCLSADQATSMAAELSDPCSGYATAFPVPSVPTVDPAFDGDEYWRGNVWLSINWLIHRGLLNYGMYDEAHDLARKSGELISRNGFQEFFNPLTGKGGKKYGRPCPRNYGWSTIVLDMLLGSRI